MPVIIEVRGKTTAKLRFRTPRPTAQARKEGKTVLNPPDVKDLYQFKTKTFVGRDGGRYHVEGMLAAGGGTPDEPYHATVNATDDIKKYRQGQARLSLPHARATDVTAGNARLLKNQKDEAVAWILFPSRKPTPTSAG